MSPSATSSIRPSHLSEPAEEFIRQGVYLRDWSPRTVRTYRQGLASLEILIGAEAPSAAKLVAWVVAQREPGLAAGGINMYARTLNSYLSWLHTEGRTADRLRVKLLPNPPKPYATFSDADLRLLIAHRAVKWAERRAWTLAVLLLDTGVRITEALTLKRDDVDLDALTIRVLGKGRKIRLVPISVQGRRAIFRWLNRAPSRLVFGTTRDRQWSTRNAHRDVTTLCRAIGIKAPRVNPHAFRHCFAVNYVGNGGDLYRLARILGHSSLSTTERYLRSMGVDHLHDGHAKFSPLGRLG